MSNSPSPRSAPPKIVYLTSGAAGMICGSCLHDNTLAKALTQFGVETLLVPTYTPIRTDETDVSQPRLFFGGINVYLEQKLPLLGYLPQWATRFLDSPRVLKWATSRAVQTDARDLGALTVSMLRGEHGRQRREVNELCDWLAQEIRPDLVLLSNVLIAGFVPTLKRRLNCPVVATLQGDDIFLESLPEPYQQQACDEIQRLAQSLDGFITNSEYYRTYMADLCGIPVEKISIVPLGIDTRDFEERPAPERLPGRRIGYLARLAPEKGLQVLVDAFIHLRRRFDHDDCQLCIAGWLGEHRRDFAEQQWQKLRDAGLEGAFRYFGEVGRREKVAFLQQLDLFSVPTTYREPKGLFALEALAAGVPVVLPAHGAFPEMLAAIPGGRLVPPEDPEQLAAVWHELLTDETQRRKLGADGQATVLRERNALVTAQNTWQMLAPLCGREAAV